MRLTEVHLSWAEESFHCVFILVLSKAYRHDTHEQRHLPSNGRGYAGDRPEERRRSYIIKEQIY